MSLSVSTDCLGDLCFEETLKIIKTIGFEYIHWTNHYGSDFIYSSYEIEEIKRQMKKLKLKLLDLHASRGKEKSWFSLNEYQRKSGIELIINRIKMAAELGGDIIVLHPFYYSIIGGEKFKDRYIEQSIKSLKELASVCDTTGVKIALEVWNAETLSIIETLFTVFSKDYIGFCWDTGHTNLLPPEAFDYAVKLSKERLLSMHLNDNDGDGDQHKIPFDGTVNWDVVAKTVAESPYSASRPLTFELSKTFYENMTHEEFLTKAYKNGSKILEKVNFYRN